MAKQGRKLTYRMKAFLDKRGINPDEFGCSKNTLDEFVIRSKDGKTSKTFKKCDYPSIDF